MATDAVIELAVRSARAALTEYLNTPVRTTADGGLHPKDERRICAHILSQAAANGVAIAPDWMLVAELDLPRSMLNVFAQNRDSFERAKLDDPRVWRSPGPIYVGTIRL